MELLHGCASAICAAESVIKGEAGDLQGPAAPSVPPVSQLQQPLFAFHY